MFWCAFPRHACPSQYKELEALDALGNKARRYKTQVLRLQAKVSVLTGKHSDNRGALADADVTIALRDEQVAALRRKNHQLHAKLQKAREGRRALQREDAQVVALRKQLELRGAETSELLRGARQVRLYLFRSLSPCEGPYLPGLLHPARTVCLDTKTSALLPWCA